MEAASNQAFPMLGRLLWEFVFLSAALHHADCSQVQRRFNVRTNAADFATQQPRRCICCLRVFQLALRQSARTANQRICSQRFALF